MCIGVVSHFIPSLLRITTVCWRQPSLHCYSTKDLPPGLLCFVRPASAWNRSRPLSIHCIVDQIVDKMSSLNFSLVLRLTLLLRLGLILHEEVTACHTTVVHIQNGTFLNTYELITCFHESWIYDFYEIFLVFLGL